MSRLADYVVETASNPGTGTVSLAGAPTGRRSFMAALGAGAAYYYITDGVQAEWGSGTVSAGTPNTLSRDTVLGNTAGTTAKLNFTGTVTVYNALPAARSLYLDATTTQAPSDAGKFLQATPYGFRLIAGLPRSALEYRGAVVCKLGAVSIPNGVYSILGYAAGDVLEDTDGFWSAGQAGSLVIPGGSSAQRVRLTGYVSLNCPVAQTRIYARLMRNGADMAMFPIGTADNSGRAGVATVQIMSPVLTCVPGDYFYMMVYQSSGISVDTTGYWLALEVIK